MKSADTILKELGLGENEIRVFLASLKIGLATVSQIAEEAHLGRTYVYELVKQLTHKGLVAEIEERGVRKMESLDYPGLLAYVGRKQREIERVEKDLIQSAGTFKAFRKDTPAKTRVRFFEGVEGIKSIFAEIRKDLEKLDTLYKFYSIFSVERMEDVLPGWIEHHQHVYYEPYMRKFSIVSDTPRLKDFLNLIDKYRQKNFSHKIWPRGKGEFPTDTLCWLNKIAWLDMKERPSGIIIENKPITDTFVMWFEQMWAGLR